MDTEEYEDGKIKKITSMDDTMLRFVSKEGCNQFPTVVLLANRMYLSDEINMIKDLNIDIKMKVGDDYHWYKSSDFRSNLRTCVHDIISGVTFFKEDNAAKLSNVTKVFKVSETEMYFVSGSELLFGTYNSQVKITNTDGIDVKKIFTIFRQGLDDFAVIDNFIYYIDKSSHIMAKKYSSNSEINDVSANTNYMVLATSSGGEVLIRGSNGNLSKSHTIKHESWTEPDPNAPPSSTGDGSSSGGFIIVTNGFPMSNVATLCCIIGDYFYIGDTSTMTKAILESVTDKGEKSAVIFTKHYRVCGKESYFLHSTYTTIGEGSVTLRNSSAPIEIIYDGQTKMAVYQTSLDVYDSSNVHICTFNSNNGLPNVLSVLLNGVDELKVISTSGKIYTSSSDLGLTVIPIHFVFEDNVSDESLDCKLFTFTVRQLIRTIIDTSVYNDLLAKVNGKQTRFVSIISKRGNKTLFTYFGNDTRQKGANSLKKVCEIFDIK